MHGPYTVVSSNILEQQAKQSVVYVVTAIKSFFTGLLQLWNSYWTFPRTAVGENESPIRSEYLIAFGDN